mgnify:CR=1 FL=1
MCIRLVLTLLVLTTIGATTTTTTIGTRVKPMASVPPIEKSSLCTCNKGTSQGPRLFIEKNSSKAITATVASHYVPLQPIGTGINMFIDREEEQRNKLQENHPPVIDGKKEKKEKKEKQKQKQKKMLELLKITKSFVQNYILFYLNGS